MSPEIVKVYSENAEFQQIESLRRSRTKRQKHREFFVEGVRSINLALQHYWSINAFIYPGDAPLSGWATEILEHSTAKRHIELPLELVRKLSGKEDTSELLALVAMPPDDLTRIALKPDLLVVVFDRPASPGNLGTLIRSCDALQVDGMLVTGHSVDLYDPETIRATTGSFFAVPTARLPSHKELIPWLETVGRTIGDFQLVGSSAKAHAPIWEHDFTRPTVLVVGNETWGLSASYKTLCDAMVRIPITGSATSLNVACAASIMLYEIDRQRQTRSNKRV